MKHNTNILGKRIASALRKSQSEKWLPPFWHGVLDKLKEKYPSSQIYQDSNIRKSYIELSIYTNYGQAYIQIRLSDSEPLQYAVETYYENETAQDGYGNTKTFPLTPQSEESIFAAVQKAREEA